MNAKSSQQSIGSAAHDGWSEGGSFVSAVLSGALLGFLVDRWLGTSPWMLGAGVGLGAFSGFRTLYRLSVRAGAPHSRTLPGEGSDDV